MRTVSYGISDEHHAKAWAPCLPLSFQGRTKKKQYHLNIRFVSIATMSYDNKKSAPCGGGGPAVWLVVGFEADRPNEFHTHSAIQFPNLRYRLPPITPYPRRARVLSPRRGDTACGRSLTPGVDRLARIKTYPPSIRTVSYGISDEHHAKAWAPCLPLSFQGRTKKKQYHLNIRFVSIATMSYDNKKSAPCGGGGPAVWLVVGFEADRPNEFLTHSAIQFPYGLQCLLHSYQKNPPP